jgi:hypothetical protein
VERVLAQVMPWRNGVVADLTAAVTTALMVEAPRVAVVHTVVVEATAAASVVKT